VKKKRKGVKRGEGKIKEEQSTKIGPHTTIHEEKNGGEKRERKNVTHL